MNKTQQFQLRISSERFISVDLAAPSGDWFGDKHLQEILAVIAEQFYDIYSLEEPKVFRTPRTTFSAFCVPKNFKSYIFQPNYGENLSFSPLSSVPKVLSIRVLGNGNVGNKLMKQTTLDSALRIVRE